MKLHFLLQALSLHASVAYAQERIQDECIRTKVAILGAGVAGITAAQALANQSIDDFVIVEYQDRMGGRLLEVNFGQKLDGSSYIVEAGASWVQGLGSFGRPENPIYTLVKKYNLEALISDDSNVTTYDRQGKSNYRDMLKKFKDAKERVAIQAGSALRNNFQDQTARAALRLVGWNPPPDDAHAQVAEWFSFDGEYMFTPEESSDVFTSVVDNATFKYLSDESRFIHDQRGFSTIVKNEAGTFLKPNDPRLHLRTIVSGINYTDHGVTISTRNGTCIDAEYTIMTFSLGVLQRDIIEFYPEFPSWKKIAIANFEFGTYTKIFLQFNQSFWDKTQYILWADPHQRGYYPQFQPLDLPEGLPDSRILIATVVNKQAYKVEAQSNEETQAEIMAVLRRMYGVNIPDPTAIYYARWTQEPWAYGSFSNWPPSTSLQTHQNLRANVGRLFFAGEATSQEFFGYLQGAYFEGLAVGGMVARASVLSTSKSQLEELTPESGEDEGHEFLISVDRED
ncbi:hypothetical protein FQN57_000217 [Myotisia sp. PD_48]|nr:hypothetical protein FQN57_000217 [Myotisia sp. PD_48]